MDAFPAFKAATDSRAPASLRQGVSGNRVTQEAVQLAAGRPEVCCNGLAAVAAPFHLAMAAIVVTDMMARTTRQNRPRRTQQENSKSILAKLRAR